MRILSLFDGMSCGRLALERAKLPVTSYLASEIDKYAIQITENNYPDTKHIGDVRQVKGDKVGKVDFLIGGSPCTGFSFAGKQLNFEDPQSVLFFEYLRVLRESKPKWFFYENVVMAKKSENIITSLLKVKPIMINSNLMSVQNRKRLYWTNIPNITMPEDKGLYLRDILLKKPLENEPFTLLSETTQARFVGYGMKFVDENTLKAKILSAREYEKNGRQGNYVKVGTGKVFRIRKLTPSECEVLQTVPTGYTEGVSNTRRYHMLGNGWTVDIITHMFKELTKINNHVINNYTEHVKEKAL